MTLWSAEEAVLCHHSQHIEHCIFTLPPFPFPPLPSPPLPSPLLPSPPSLPSLPSPSLPCPPLPPPPGKDVHCSFFCRMKCLSSKGRLGFYKSDGHKVRLAGKETTTVDTFIPFVRTAVIQYYMHYMPETQYSPTLVYMYVL